MRRSPLDETMISVGNLSLDMEETFDATLPNAIFAVQTSVRYLPSKIDSLLPFVRVLRRNGRGSVSMTAAAAAAVPIAHHGRQRGRESHNGV